MPMNRDKYPADWEQISTDLKDQVDWKCEGCRKQCRVPGEPFDTHRRTLTVAHINHVELDCNPGNLICLCAPCHLALAVKDRYISKALDEIEIVLLQLREAKTSCL